MGYNTKEYEADKKIAEMIFNRHFRSFKQYKDDMIQVAIIRLWQSRKHDVLSPYCFTWACKVVRTAMIDFIRPHAKFLNEVSIFDKTDEDLLYMDILGEDDTAELARLRCERLNDLVNKKIDCMNDKAKEIIKMYMNHRSYSDIAKTVGTTKQNIGEYVGRFRKAMKAELDKEA